jgi:hypothetical protein
MGENEIADLCEQIRAGASDSDVMHWLTQHASSELAAERGRADTLAKEADALAQCGDYWQTRAEKAEAERDRLRAAMVAVDDYLRVTTFANGCLAADVEVARGTLNAALQEAER